MIAGMFLAVAKGNNELESKYIDRSGLKRILIGKEYLSFKEH